MVVCMGVGVGGWVGGCVCTPESLHTVNPSQPLVGLIQM